MAVDVPAERVTDKPCQYCKEAKDRDTKYLVELPLTTEKLRLKVRVCPHCDGGVTNLAFKPR